MRFVHAADLHLDSPLRGLERYEGAPVERIRGATRAALRNLVELCLDEEVDFVLLAGDLFDGDWKDYSTGLFFASQMSRLREAQIPVYMVRGNHDAASQIGKHLQLPDNVRELSTRAPETVIDERCGVAIHGQSFATRAVTHDLAATYPRPVDGLLNIGILHTCLDGRPGHDPYAPTSVETLVDTGYDYWALGHVHNREVVATDPWIVFPGNLQGRHARETGPKGATVVDASGAAIRAVEHRPLDAVRWQQLEIDAADANTGDDVVDLARAALEAELERCDGRLLAARLVVGGASRAHEALHVDPERWDGAIRAAANDLGGDVVWVERIRFATGARLDRDALAQRDDAVGQLVRALKELRHDEDALLELARQELAELQRKLPREAREGDEGVRLDDPEPLRSALDDVEQILFTRLMSKSATE